MGDVEKQCSQIGAGDGNGARKVAHTVRIGKWGARKTDAKERVHIELGDAAHFVKAGLWQPLLRPTAMRIVGSDSMGLSFHATLIPGWREPKVPCEYN